MKTSFVRINLILILASALFANCTAVNITKSYPSLPVKMQGRNIHVVQKTTVENIALMQRMQFQLGRQLTSMGYLPTNCLQLDSTSGDSIYLERLLTNNEGRLLVIEMLRKQQDTSYFQVNPFPASAAPGGDQYIGYITDLHEKIFQMDRFIADTRYTWEIRMYDTNTKQLIYCVTAIITNPFSDAAMVKAYTKFITKDILGKQLLQSHFTSAKLPF